MTDRPSAGRMPASTAARTGITEDGVTRLPQAHLERARRTLRAHSRSNRALLNAATEEEYLQEVCRIISEECGYPMVWVGIAEMDEKKSVTPAFYADVDKGFLDGLRLTWADVERGRGPTGTAIRTRKAALCRDVRVEPGFAPWRAAALDRGYASVISLPLLAEGSAIGALTIYAKEPDPFTEEDITQLTDLADDFAQGIATLRLREAHTRAVEALRASEERYRALIETTGDFIWEVDCKGRFTYCSPQMEPLWAMKPASMIGVSPLEVMPPDSAARCSESLRRLLEDPKPFSGMEVISYDGRGRVIWIEISGVPFFAQDGSLLGYRGITRDITDRKEAEDLIRRSQESIREGEARLKVAEAIRAERQRLFAVLENLPAYVILLDADYRVPFANRFFRERFGESGGRRCHEYLFDRATPCENCQTYKVLGSGEPQHWNWTGPDGRDYDIYDSPFMDSDGTTLILEMGIDITEMKKAEAALRALAGELSKTEQRERRRLSAILHDHIQQLLVASRMQLDALRNAKAVDVPGRVVKIGAIISEAIEASRSLAVELSPPILHQEGLAVALEWLSGRMMEKNMFSVRVKADREAEPALESARFLLFEAARELLLNAIKYSGVTEAAVVMERTSQGWTRIIVSDNGRGFDPSSLDKHAGGGFGLFSIQQRLTHMGGRMEIDSSAGRGTRIVLMAPPGGI